MLVIDSDVFLIDCRYQRDPKHDVNRRFLDELTARQVEKATTLFNVLEICGVLTFNLNAHQLRAFYANFAKQYAGHVERQALRRQNAARCAHTAGVSVTAGRHGVMRQRRRTIRRCCSGKSLRRTDRLTGWCMNCMG